MKMLKKMSLSSVLAGIVLIAGMQGNAVAETKKLDQVFGDLLDTGGAVSYNSPGYFQSQTRSGVTAGSGRIRFGNTQNFRTPNLVSFTPPSISMGCNGIDWQLGGASWISGDQLKQMLEGIIPAALWYIVQMVIGAICGDCAASLVNALENVQRAVNMLSNSCEVGKRLAADFVNMAPGVKEGMCNGGKTWMGSSEDMGAARETCQNDDDHKYFFQEMWDVGSGNAAGRTPEEEEQAKDHSLTLEAISGNRTWTLLKAMGIVRPRKQVGQECDNSSGNNESMSEGCNEPISDEHARSYIMGVLFQSLIGTEVSPDRKVECLPENRSTTEAEGNSAATTPMCKSFSIAGTANVEGMLSLFLCGTQVVKGSGFVGASAGEQIAAAVTEAHCIEQGYFTGQAGLNDWRVLDCKPPENSGSTGGSGPGNPWWYEDCLSLPTGSGGGTPVGEWLDQNQWAGEQFDKGFLYLVSTTLFQASIDIAEGRPLSTEAQQLIAVAPFPLYKLLNLSTLFPGAERLILGESAIVIAYMLVDEYFNQIYRDSLANRSTTKLNIDLLESMELILQNLQDTGNKLIVAVDESQKRVDQYVARINSLERQVMSSVYSKNIMGGYQFSVDLMDAANQPQANSAPSDIN